MYNRALYALLFTTSVLSAQEFTWVGTTPAWSTSSNWSPTGTPGNESGSPDSVYFQGTHNSSPTISSNTYLTNISFTATSVAYTVGRSSGQLIFPDTTFSGTISLSDSVTDNQTIDAPILIGNLLQFTNNSSFSLTVSEAISSSGTQGISKQGTGTLILSAANTYTGSTLISAGILYLSEAGALPASTVVTVSGGATFDISGITPASSQTVAGLTGAGSVILGDRLLEVSSSSSRTFSGVISGVGGSLSVTGSSTLTLTNANTYTGATTITGGTLSLSGAGALSSSTALTVGGGATFNMSAITPASSQTVTGLTGAGSVVLGNKLLIANLSSPNTFSGAISGTGGSLSLAGSSTLILSGTNTYTGATTIPASTTLASGAANSFSASSAHSITGTLDLGGFSNTVNSISGTGTIESTGGTPTLTVSNGGTFDGVIQNGTGTLALTVSGGTLTLTNANTYTGATTVGSGAGMILTGSGIVSSETSLFLNGSFDVSAITPGSLTLSGITTDNSSANLILGSKELILTGMPSSIYFGSISGAGGSLNLMSFNLALVGNSTYTGATTIDASSVLQLTSTNAGSASSDYSILGTLTVLNTVTVGSITGDGVINTGELPFPAVLEVMNGGTFSGAMQDPFPDMQPLSLVVSGGTLTLSGVNTYHGSTTVNTGTLVLSGSGTIANTSGVNVDGTFDISASTSSPIVVGAITGGTGTIDLGNNELSFGGATPHTFNGTITGAGGSLTYTGTSTFTLGVTDSDYTGTTTINAGATFQSGVAGAFAPLSDYVINGTLSLNNFSNTVSTIAGTGTIALGSGNLTVTDGGSYSGTITGSGGINLSGGTLTLAGTAASPYTGTFTASSSAILRTGSSASTLNNSNVILEGSSTLDLQSFSTAIQSLNGSTDTIVTGAGGTLTINSSGSFGGIIQGSSNIVMGSTGPSLFSYQFSNVNTTTGTFTSNYGNIAFVTNGSFPATSGFILNGTSSLNISNVTSSATIRNLSGTSGTTIVLGSKELILDYTSNQTYSGNISGVSGTLRKTGSSQLTLAGTNTYTGPTIVSTGALLASTPGALSPSSDFTIDGTLILDNSNTIKSLTGSGTITTDVMGAPVLTITNGGSFTGTVGSDLGIIVSGATLILNPTGSNTYYGPTTVNNGATLSAGKANALSALSGINVNGTLALNNFPNTIFQLMGIATGVVDTGTTPGVGILTMSAFSESTYEGSITGAGGITLVSVEAPFRYTLTLATTTSSNTYTGPTTIQNYATLKAGAVNAFSPFSDYNLESNGILDTGGFNNTIASLSSISSAAQVIMSGSILTINGGENTSYAGSFTDSGTCGGLTIDGGGTLTLTGTSEYCGATSILNGLLEYSGSGTPALNSAINVSENGGLSLLNDSVTYEGFSLFNEGIFANQSVLELSSSYEQTSSGSTEILFEEAPYTKISTGSNLILDGELQVQAIMGFPTTGSYTLLSSEAERQGTFATFTPIGFGMSSPNLAYSRQNVYLVFSGCDNTWSLDENGNWNDVDNWDGGCVPGVNTNDNDVARFTSLVSDEISITLADGDDDPQSLILSGLYFDSMGTEYTINQLSSDTTITFDSTGSVDPQITSLAGSHTLNAPLILNRATALALGDGSTLTFGEETTLVSNSDSAGFVIYNYENIEANGTLVNSGTLTPYSFIQIGSTVDNRNLITPVNSLVVSPVGEGATATVINNTTGAKMGPTATGGFVSIGLTGVTVVQNTGVGAEFGPTGANSTFIILGENLTTVTNSGVGTKMGAFGANSTVSVLEGTVHNELGALFIAGSGGEMLIDGGTVNNDLMSTVGAVNHNLILSGGGVLNSSGNVFALNYTQTSPSTLQLNIISAPDINGTVFAAGTGTVGGTLKLNSLASNFSAGQTIDLIFAENGISGTYNQVEYVNFPSGLIPQILYGETQIQLQFSPTVTSTPTGSMAQLPFTSINQMNLWIARQSHGLHRSIAKKRGENKELASLVRLDDQLLALDDSSFDESTKTDLALANFFTKNREREKIVEKQNPSRFYIGPIDNCGHMNRQNTSQAGFSYNSVGFLTGYDYSFDTFGLGIELDFARTSAHVNHHAGSLSASQLHASGYGVWTPSSLPNLGIDLIVGYGYEWFDTSRLAGTGVTEVTAKGSTQGMITNILLGTEYIFGKNQFNRIPRNLFVTPFFSLQHLWMKADQYNEHGAGVYNLNVHGQHANSLRSTLGSRLEWVISKTNMIFTPEIDLGWQYEFLDNNRNVSFATLQLAQNQLITNGIVGAGRNTLLFGIDLSFVFYKVFEVEASYDLQWNSLYTNNALYFGLGGRF